MSLALLKKTFSTKKEKSQVFILGIKGSGKSSVLNILQKRLHMKDKGSHDIAGVSLETIKGPACHIYSYTYEKKTFSTMTQFIHQTITKCIIFVVDSRKQHILADSHRTAIKHYTKEIAKCITEQCHLIILCNKQDITDEPILTSDEITNILDLKRTFSGHKYMAFPISCNDSNTIAPMITYLVENNIVSYVHDEEDEKKFDTKKRDSQIENGAIGNLQKDRENKKKTSFLNILKKKKKLHNEVIMIFGLHESGKSKILDSFGFGKKSKTSIAIFETETLKLNQCEFHCWNYEQRSWPMVKSFFPQTTLVIFVIDGTNKKKLHSNTGHVWTVETYLKKLIGITHEMKKNLGKASHMQVSASWTAKNDGFGDGSGDDCDDNIFGSINDSKKKNDETEEVWPLKCPFLFYINKSDCDDFTVSKNDLESEMQLSRLMKSKGIPHHVQECSAKTKTGVYDGLVWCCMNGCLSRIEHILKYASDNDIKLPTVNYQNKKK